MKKILLFAALCFAIPSIAETVFVYNTDSHELSQTKDGITVTIATGSGSTDPKWNVSFNEDILPSDMRLYTGNTITVSSNTALKDIKMVFAKSCASNKNYAGLSASPATLVSGGDAENYSDWKVDSWTGNANSVTFTLTGSGQRQIYSIVIDGDALLPSTPEDKPLPTEADLVTNYNYTEPTIVNVPDTTILTKEYAFIRNNILTHCSQGSIIKETDTTYAYFNCNANYSITFTASQNIKGIAISGFVRKAFNATCDHGDLTFLTDEDFDMEGWPALVITDINNKDVTLYCPKQFRCYELKVYFKENPDPLGTETNIRPTTTDPKRTSNKILVNGQLYIQKDGHTYSAQGQQIH